MSGNVFSIGDRVELLTDFCGFSSGMIGYAARSAAQCDVCILVRLFQDKPQCLFEIPVRLLRKVNPPWNEVFINEDIDAYNMQIEQRRAMETCTQNEPL